MMSTWEELSGMKGLRIAHLNIRSLFPKLEMIKEHLLASNIDILLLSETWLKEVFPTELIEIEGYKITRFDRSIMTAGNNVKSGVYICEK